MKKYQLEIKVNESGLDFIKFNKHNEDNTITTGLFILSSDVILTKESLSYKRVFEDYELIGTSFEGKEVYADFNKVNVLDNNDEELKSRLREMFEEIKNNKNNEKGMVNVMKNTMGNRMNVESYRNMVSNRKVKRTVTRNIRKDIKLREAAMEEARRIKAIVKPEEVKETENEEVKETENEEVKEESKKGLVSRTVSKVTKVVAAVVLVPVGVVTKAANFVVEKVTKAAKSVAKFVKGLFSRKNK